MLALVLGCFAAGLLLQWRVPALRSLVPWLDQAVLAVFLPALILARLPDLALGADLAVPVAAAWGSIGLAAITVLLLARRLRWSRETTGALLLVTPLGNTTFIGLALVEALLGDAQLTRALAFDQLGTFVGLATYGSIIAARWGGHADDARWGAILLRLVRFPAFVAVLVSFPLRAVDVPVGLDSLLGDVGQLVAPVAMFTLGLRFRVVAVGAARQAAIWCLTTKMVLLPLTVLVVAVIVGGRRDPAWQASVLEAGMPPMVTAGVFAARAGLDDDLATTVIGVGLLLALVTIPVLSLAVG